MSLAWNSDLRDTWPADPTQPAELPTPAAPRRRFADSGPYPAGPPPMADGDD